MARDRKKRINKPKKPGLKTRAANAYLTTEQSIRNPTTIGPRVRAFLLGLWKARGGGYYGLGYVITFVSLEISMFFTDVNESEGLSDFVSEQVVSLIFRFAFESILNSFLALIWPVLLISRFELNGVIILAASFIIFQWGIKPRLDEKLYTKLNIKKPKLTGKNLEKS